MDILELRQLEAFRTVMERGSVTTAAKLLGVSQPAVSNLLAKLEEALGYTLFVREHRRLTPNSEAMALFGEVVAVLDRHAQLVRTAREVHNGKSGTLVIASSPGPSISWLPQVIASFIASRPEVSVKLISRQSQGVRELIGTGTFELAIAELPIEHPMVAVRRYQTDLVAVLSIDHPLSRQRYLTPEALDGMPFIGMFRGHAGQLGAARAFDNAGAYLKVVAECDYFASAMSLAAQGVGVALVDPLSARNAKDPTLVIREFVPTIQYEFAVVQPRDRPLSKLAISFADAMDSYLKSAGIRT